MNNNLTSINIVLDRSGSMAPVIKETLLGLNTFLADQKNLPGEAILSLATFASDYTLVFDCKPLSEIPDITNEHYKTGGFTCLLDAIARTINATGQKLSTMKEEDRPSKVLLVIITDGEENSSREFTRDRVFEMIAHQQSKYSWTVVYLGANQDAIKTSATLGISAGNSIRYCSDSVGTTQMYGTLTANARNLRRSKTVGSVSNFFDNQNPPSTSDQT
jgi:uncharacterized protein YegL